MIWAVAEGFSLTVGARRSSPNDPLGPVPSRRGGPVRVALLLLLALVAAACSSTPATSSSGGGAEPAATTVATTQSAPQAVQYFPIWVDFPAPGQAWGLFWEQYSAQGCAMVVAHQGSPGVFVSPATFGHFVCGNSMAVAEVVSDGRGDVLAYGPELYISHDAGKSFTRVPQPGGVLALSAVGSSIWMLEALCPSSAAQSAAVLCPLGLFTSNDGGRSFAVDSHLPAIEVGSGSVLMQGAGLHPNWLQRPSAGVGYVFVPPLGGATPGAPARTGESVYRSADGGASWTRSSIAGCAAGMYGDASVNPQGQAMVICGGQPSAGYQPKSVFVSPGDGLQWEARFDCLGLGSSCGSARLNNGYLGLVAYISPTTAFAGGGRSQLLVSHDGGVSWQLVPGVGYNGDTYSAAFFGSLGYVFGDDGSVSQGYIWTTTDSGVQWNRTAVRIAG